METSKLRDTKPERTVQIMADEESSMGHRIPGDEDDTIYEMAESCENLLRLGRSALESYGSSISILLEEYEQRFTAWADYLGVFAKRSISLDRRLQHHPDIQDLVVRLLEILKTNLTYCKSGSTTQADRCQPNQLQ
jgi:hypothetical protein